MGWDGGGMEDGWMGRGMGWRMGWRMDGMGWCGNKTLLPVQTPRICHWNRETEKQPLTWLMRFWALASLWVWIPEQCGPWHCGCSLYFADSAWQVGPLSWVMQFICFWMRNFNFRTKKLWTSTDEQHRIRDILSVCVRAHIQACIRVCWQQKVMFLH